MLIRFFFFLLLLNIVATSIAPLEKVENQPKQVIQQSLHFPFQKKIWTYWNSDKNEIPIIVRVCLENLQLTAKKHNFTFVCLNDSNVRDYITKYDEHFTEVRKKSIQTGVAHAADLLRMLVIQQQGGIWVDSTTIFVNGLTEIQNIMSQQYKHMITNGFSPQPDALLFFYSNGQNRLETRIVNPHDPSTTILYNEFPNYEIWFIAAKKNSTIMRQVRKTYTEFTMTQTQLVQRKFVDEDIFMNRINDFGHYLYLNMAVSYTIQKKQVELDKQLTVFGQRQSAFQFYKIWGLHSEYGPMIMIREDIIPIDFIFLYSKDELLQKGFKFRFFMKQFGYFRYYAGRLIDNLLKAFQKKMTFQQFISSSPSGDLCGELTLIVEGSIMDKLLKSSSVLQTYDIRIVTKQQNQRWQDYCQENGSLVSKVKKYFFSSIFHTFILRMFMYDKVHKAKVHQILYFGKDLSLSQWIHMKYLDNQFLLFDFCYILVVSMLLFWIYNFLLALFQKKLFQHMDLQHIAQQSTDIPNEVEKKQRRKISTGLSCLSKKTRTKRYLIKMLIFLLFLINCTIYNAIDLTGGREQPYTILLCIILSYLLEWYIERQVYQARQCHEVRYQYEFFFLFINYMTTYIGLVHVVRNRFWLNWCSLIIGCVGPCLMKMHRVVRGEKDAHIKQGEERQQKEQTQFELSETTIYRLMMICLVTAINLFPNVKYLAGQEGYCIKWIVVIPVIYLLLLSVYLLIQCITARLWHQIVRLVILAVICLQLYSLIDRLQGVTNLNRRMVFVFRTVVILQAVYLQVGSDRKIKNLSRCTFLKSPLNQSLVFFAPILIEFVFGRFYWNFKNIKYNLTDYSQHLVIFAYSAFIVALFMEVEKTDQYQEVEKFQLTEIEISQRN